MNINHVKVPKTHVSDLEAPYLSRKTPQNLVNCHHSLIGLFGSKGAGKTTRVIEWIQMMQSTNSYDKIIWWSPTFADEEKSKNITDHYNCEVIPKYTDERLIEIKEWMKSEIKEYKQYFIYKKLYEKYAKYVRQYEGLSQPDFIQLFTHDELVLLEKYDFQPPGENRYKYGFPAFLMVFDDMLSEKKIFAANAKGVAAGFFMNMRHASCSVILSVQVFKNGIPACLRGGMVDKWLLFENYSDKQKKIISEEICCKIKPEKVIEAWDLACAKPHNFLYIDYSNPDRSKLFRRNWDDIINLSGENTVHS